MCIYMYNIYIYIYIICVYVYIYIYADDAIAREFKDVVFEDVVFDNDRSDIDVTLQNNR